MNVTLKTAIDRLASLPEEEQELFANWLMAELDDEARWQAMFDASLPRLKQMADEALAEHKRGETKPWLGFED